MAALAWCGNGPITVAAPETRNYPGVLTNITLDTIESLLHDVQLLLPHYR
jgi:hypothetical protein